MKLEENVIKAKKAWTDDIDDDKAESKVESNVRPAKKTSGANKNGAPVQDPTSSGLSGFIYRKKTSNQPKRWHV